MKNIVWLASYPKSGNTWFRAFINVINHGKLKDINKMKTDGIFSSKIIFEDVLDINPDSIKAAKIDAYRRLVFQFLSDTSESPLFIKIHDAYSASRYDNLPIVPTDSSKIALYIVRNPLDVSLSLANHLNTSLENAINKYINNTNSRFILKPSEKHSQFAQTLGTWASHLESWMNQNEIPIHLIRYEDMKAKPFETFKNALKAIGMDVTDEQIQMAIEETKFEKLREKELEQGFKENQNLNSTFFFKGEVGRWKTELRQEQVDMIIAINGEMMKKMGYL